MQRNKDVTFAGDGTTNRRDNAARNVFSLTGFVRKVLKLGFTPANQSHRTLSGQEKLRYPPVLRFSLNRLAVALCDVPSRADRVVIASPGSRAVGEGDRRVCAVAVCPARAQ